MGVVKILFISDTHLGYDLPMKPRIKRRRRGDDFYKNYKKALAPALNKQVDCVIHGGDLFFRSKVPLPIAQMAFEPLNQIAGMGIPVYIVPGNHERSVIPHREILNHPLIHSFEKPGTFLLETEKGTLSISGFPFVRQNIRNNFSQVLTQTKWKDTKADARLLCIHQAVEGATVGVQNYTFRYSHDVIRINDIPRDFLVVLSGHIHRAQLLQADLTGQPANVPVFYSGSIDRTSFAERGEPKGYLTFCIEPGISIKSKLMKWDFHELKT